MVCQRDFITTKSNSIVSRPFSIRQNVCYRAYEKSSKSELTMTASIIISITIPQTSLQTSLHFLPNQIVERTKYIFFSCSIYIIHLVESSFYFSFVLSLAYQNGHTKQRRGWESFYQSNSVAVAYIVGYDELGFFFFFSFFFFKESKQVHFEGDARETGLFYLLGLHLSAVK